MTTPLALALVTAQSLLLDRAEVLAARIKAGDDVWAEYLAALQGLVAVAGQLAPEASGRMLTTAELAERLGVSSKTILRRKAKGELTPAVQLGERGRAALRWAAR
jgi:predicted DNA-binding transcriptional regulator AlpA